MARMSLLDLAITDEYSQMFESWHIDGERGCQSKMLLEMQ